MQIRHELINQITEATLNDLLDGLMRPEKCVITDRERNEIVQGIRVTQDKVTCLIDMVRKKGEKPCVTFLSLLKEKQPVILGKHGL